MTLLVPRRDAIHGVRPVAVFAPYPRYGTQHLSLPRRDAIHGVRPVAVFCTTPPIRNATLLVPRRDAIHGVRPVAVFAPRPRCGTRHFSFPVGTPFMASAPSLFCITSPIRNATSHHTDAMDGQAGRYALPRNASSTHICRQADAACRVPTGTTMFVRYPVRMPTRYQLSGRHEWRPYGRPVRNSGLSDILHVVRRKWRRRRRRYARLTHRPTIVHC